MENNNRRARVREKLAYIFAGSLVAGFFLTIVGKMLGYDVALPEAITSIMGTIIAFYFAGEYSREKPES